MSRNRFLLWIVLVCLVLSSRPAQGSPGYILIDSQAQLAANRADLLSRATEQPVIFVGTEPDLVQELGIDAFVMRPTTGRYVVSGVYTVNGQTILGGFLVPADTPFDVQTAASLYAQHLQKMAQPFRPQPMPAGSRRLFLPAMRYKSEKFWNSVPILSNQYYLCPNGIYNDSIVAQQALPADDYEYWGFQIQQETVGGVGGCRSSWVYESIWNSVQTGLPQPYRHGPTTTTGTVDATVDIGFAAGLGGVDFNLAWNWKFRIPDVMVIDRSKTGEHEVGWQIDYIPASPVAKYTYVSEPGFSLVQDAGDHPVLYRPVNLWFVSGSIAQWYYNDAWYIEYHEEVQ